MSNFTQVLDYLSSFSSELEKGQVFERYCKWFLKNDHCYAMQLKNVWLWNEWPGNWGRDKGIDLIAETHNGDLWAIQAKAYDKTHYITKEDVDKFLSESARTEIAYRLLISTTNLIGPNAREVMDAQEKQVGKCLLERLESSLLPWPLSIDNLIQRITKNPYTPRAHQEKAIQDCKLGFETSQHGQLHMACGTGKTLVGLWLAERLKSQNTLVLVPSISLIAQISQEWANNSSGFLDTFYPIFVCSDPTVSKRSDGPDEMNLNSSELGFQVTTDAHEIIRTFSSTSMPKVIFSTYHSSPVIAETCRLDPSLSFDIVIADEAHRCAGPSSSEFTTIVKQDAIRTKRKLFMTATPKIFSDHVKQKTKELDYEIVSMDDENKFGPVFHKLSFSEAIKLNLLSDYQVLISVMDNSTYREYTEKGRFVSVDTYETDARTLASQLLIAKAIKKFGLKRLISFHSRTRSAQEFVDTFSKSLQLLPENEKPHIELLGTIFGNMPQDKRSIILRQFKAASTDGSNLLANVKCLSEGVDVPTLDGVAFIDPKGSEIDIVQAVGRAIRKPDQNSQKIGTIIIPIFVDKATNEEVALEQSCFKPVWTVVRALRAHDDVLAEELDHLRLELGKRIFRKPPKLGKITIDVPIQISTAFSKSLTLKIVENCSSSWNFYFDLLQQYVETEGHSRVPQNYIFSGYNLGSWVSVQRKTFKQLKMRPDRKIKLEQLPGWSWFPLDQKWEDGLKSLSSFYAREGHVNVSKDHIEQGYKLGIWINNKKQDYRNGKLQKDRQLILEAFHGWKWDNNLDYSWNESYSLLKEFIKIHGHAQVPNDHKFKNFSLGVWVSTQRRAKVLGRLSAERIEKLNSLPGWAWNTIHYKNEQALKALEAFVAREGHALVPTNHIENDFKLGIWVSKQRLYYSKGTLDEKLRLKLEQYPYWYWDANIGHWELGKRLLIQFCNRENHSRVKNLHIEDGFSLGKWCQMYRYAYKKNTITQDKIDFFDALPNWSWDVKVDQWEEGFNYLKEYVIQKGNAEVPSNYKTNNGFTLGTWVSTQRYAYSQKKISIERKLKLEALGFPFENLVEIEWLKQLHTLKEFRAQYPNRWPNAKEEFPPKNKLGVWCCTQREAFKKDVLSPEKIAQLEIIDFDYNPLETAWIKQFNNLANFRQEYPHKWPTQDEDFPEGNKLGSWCNDQRKLFKKGKLNSERKAKLNEIDFPWSLK